MSYLLKESVVQRLQLIDGSTHPSMRLHASLPTVHHVNREVSGMMAIFWYHDSFGSFPEVIDTYADRLALHRWMNAVMTSLRVLSRVR
jgi:hypothetical protein